VWSKTLKIATGLAGFIMLLAVICLPITSLPLLSRLMGGTMVAPPSVILAGLALVIWLPIYFIEKRPLPREFIPLAAFFGFALVSSFLSFFLLLPPYKFNSSTSEIIQAVLTLCIGITCYVAFSLWCVSSERITWLFRLVNLGGIAIVVWSFAQLFILFFHDHQYPTWMTNIQGVLSLRPLSTFAGARRANGFAFEPSWLAHQLNAFYLPYWLAATLTGYTAFGKRIWRISAENILLLAGMVVMLGSMSRIGLLTLFLIAAYLLLSMIRFISSRLSKGLTHSTLLIWGIGVGLVLLAVLLALGVIYGMSFVDQRIARVFTLHKIPSDWFALADRFSVAERFTYWMSGFYTFGKYPVFGVGLGNAGFFFSQAIPEKARALYEIIMLETQASIVPNVKSLWLRILGETGLVGFGLFVSWMITLWASAKYLQKQTDALGRTVAWMGLIALLALVGEGFSIDSFALPYYWISFGILTAASMHARLEGKK
jgi:hypothetical protein